MKVGGIGATSQRPWLWMPSCKPGRHEGGVGWAGLGWELRIPRFPLPLGGGATQPCRPQPLSSRLLPPTRSVPEVVLFWLRVPGDESRCSRKWPGGGAPGPGSARSCWGAAVAPGSGLRHDQRAGHLRGEHDPHRRGRVSPLVGRLFGSVGGRRGAGLVERLFWMGAGAEPGLGIL